MSRVSRSRQAEAIAATVHPGSPCTICGQPVHHGGHWMARETDLYICDRDCAQKLLLLALDTLEDTEVPVPERVRFGEWLTFASETFDRWAAAERRKKAGE